MILLSLFFTFLKIGLFTIGSGYSMLVLAQLYIVDRYSWMTTEEFMDLVAISEVTPGPIIFNLATFAGARIAGFKGATAAVLGLVIIPFTVIFFLALHYPKIKEHPFARSLLRVIRPVAVGLITVAVMNLFSSSVTDLVTALIAVAVIFLVFFLKINPIAIVLSAFVLAFLIK